MQRTSRMSPFRLRFPVLSGLLLVLAACGGSGGGDSTPATVPITIDIADVSVTEGDGQEVLLSFPVTLSAAGSGTITVDYQTVADTATEGVDFTAAAGQLSFPAGLTATQVDVAITGDLDHEPDETLILRLSSPVGATLVVAEARGTIIDNDAIANPLLGLDRRPSNVTCVAPERPIAAAAVDVQEAFATAPVFVSPTKILQAPGDPSRWFVLEQAGRIQVMDVSNPAAATSYLDWSGSVVSGGERGLLGLAFHPDFPATAELYLSYTAAGGATGLQSRVSRIILDDPDTPASVTEQIILTVAQEFTNHNGGDIAFGTDNYLYLGLGDGGSGGDPNNRAQDTTRLLGSFLRLDVLGVAYPSPGYTIPASNPFFGNAKCGPGSNAGNCPEIYAWGFRNPWRWGFDTATGQLWAGDVGQGAWEEVDVVESGGNYGWRCLEGNHDYNTSGCPAGGFVSPVHEYDRALGQSITGGYVYRGSGIPGLAGRYVFADFASGRIWALQDNGGGGYSAEELIDTAYNISSFGQGEDGELYFADYGNGRIRKLVAAAGGGTDTVAELLSQSGCTDLTDVTRPYPGLVPYGMNAPFWSDGAIKDRHMGLPDGTTIVVQADGDWDFPRGTVLVKNFRLGGKLIETRHLMRHPDGVWAGYTYEWNDAQTEATRLRGGKSKLIDGHNWIYPSESECMQCHTAAAGVALGPETVQLNGDFTYASTGRTANQLATLEGVGMFSAPMGDPAGLPALADPADPGADPDARARAYLHTNCSQCHRPGGPTPSDMDWRYATPLSLTNACDVSPSHGFVGIPGGRLVYVGDASRSISVARMGRRDAMGMPPLGSSLPDSGGIAVISDWINQLTSCQ